jgi:hypothetical protein
MQARILRNIRPSKPPFEGGRNVFRIHRAQRPREEPPACRLLVLSE